MVHLDNIILGAGPAGLQMAYYLEKKGEDYLILERAGHAGAFFDRQPRHRRLLSINKRYTGYPDTDSRLRYDWNSLLGAEGAPQFVDYTKSYFPDAELLPRYLSDYAAFHHLRIRYRTDVTSVSRHDGRFTLIDRAGDKFTCSHLFVGTGFTKENVPDIPGRDLCDTYDTMRIDAALYDDKRVMIVGKGNSAFETAEHLISNARKIWVCGPKTVRLAWATHYVGDLRAVNNNFLDTYQLKAQNNILDGELQSVTRDDDKNELVARVYFSSRQRSYEYRCDHVILCTGFRFDPQVFDSSCRPTMRQCGRLPLMTSEWEAENVPEMFFVGTLMQSRDYRRTMSGFIHGFRHNIEALNHILDVRKGLPWPAQQTLEFNAKALVRELIERLSTSAALLLQPGFLCDAILVENDWSALCYLRNVPVDYAREKLVGDHTKAYLVTLEYKKQEQPTDPFAMPRGVGVSEDFYIHPVIRRYEFGRAVEKMFLSDDLDNDWREDPEHARILEAAFKSQLSGERPEAPLRSFVAELGRAETSRRETGSE